MKKILSTIVMMVIALTMQAQTIEFKTFAKGDAPESWKADNIALSAVDEKGKMMGDEGSRKFEDGQRFATRLKTGGKSDKNSTLFLTVKKAGKVTIYASSGSSDQERAVNLVKGTKKVASVTVGNQNKTPIQADVEKGEYKIEYPDGAINIYGVKFEAAE